MTTATIGGSGCSTTAMCPCPMPTVNALLARYSFQVLSGRRPGQEDTGSKLRKGVAGDWRNHFTPAVEAAFAGTTGDLVRRLGYAQ